MPGAQKSFVWFELLTSDLAAAKGFYRQVVGWDMQDMPMAFGTYTLLNVRECGIGGMMTMPAEAAAAAMRPCWAPYIEVDDVDAAAVQLREAGGMVHNPPQDIPNVGRFAVVADPSGALFNLYRSNTPAARSVSNEPGHVGWCELHSKDAAKAFDFYSQLYGWSKSDAMDMGPMGIYQIFSIDGIQSGAMFNSPAAQHVSFWLIYFSVADIDDAGARLNAAGGKVTQGPMQVPGNLWIIQAADPQGAAFALVGTRR